MDERVSVDPCLRRPTTSCGIDTSTEPQYPVPTERQGAKFKREE